ncbi:cobalamin biosynthesis protein [Colwellia sp. E2M01]|uniref:cobalamin biosynthesis protein CobD/CbiB n=1 Tax=Colwellia sp. E2M01 TaxID=2841561 RepID=UPI001C09F518|nr:cobalamin biosynthesis protein [Colwellia sp. E2M01]MBU2871024.1 cobalamin biosynthesis protein [Colwellia sp. E2M01]
MIEFSELTAFTYHVVILVTVLIIKFIASHFVVHEPLRYFQFYCMQLSKKVNNRNNSNAQQIIAGLLALLITLIPLVIILWLFAEFVEVDYIWQGLLLYCSLGSLHLGQFNKDIAQALASKQKHLAKQTLKPLVLRETATLSIVGLSKAAIEMQLLRSMQQIYVVSFIFIVAGPLAALSYRLILEMHYCWNTKLISFKYFGFYSQFFSQILQWIPNRVMTLMLLLGCLGQGSFNFWRSTKQHFFALNNNFIIAVHALSLSIRLGGVAIYLQETSNADLDDKANPEQNSKHDEQALIAVTEAEKLRKPAFNDTSNQPMPIDMIKATSKVNFAIYGSLFLLVLLAVAWQYLSHLTR